MARPKKAAGQATRNHTISFEQDGGPLRAFQARIRVENRSEAVNAAVRVCLQALKSKRLSAEDFHLSQLRC